MVDPCITLLFDVSVLIHFENECNVGCAEWCTF